MFQLSHVSPQQRRGSEPLITHKHFQRHTLLFFFALGAATPRENKRREFFFFFFVSRLNAATIKCASSSELLEVI